jgi:tRNA pseudouridine32 synthase/23S rRNA pseudouridine746 synthase
LAVLDGWLADDQGQVAAAIAKDKRCFPRVKICPITGKMAVSEYRVLHRLENPRSSLVQFTPLTGRTHQLRIHSYFIGHPILGCDLYKSDRSEQLADRLLLHASDLYFEHPVGGEPFHGECPCPF